jgi:hypothetical protein
MEEEKSISQTEGFFSESDILLKEDMTADDFRNLLEEKNISTRDWLNNFHLKIYDSNYRSNETQEMYPELTAMIKDVDQTYEDGNYSMDYEEFKRNIRANWSDETELIVIDLYIKMLRRGYPRYSQQKKVSLIS